MMNNLNSVLLEGVLKADPLYRVTPKGTHVCTFSLVSNRYFKKDELGLEKEVSYFDVGTMDEIADYCHVQGHEGRGVRVVGRLKQECWTGADGKKKSRVVIMAEHVEFRPEER